MHRVFAIKGIRYRGGEWMEFHSPSQVARGMIIDDTKLNGIEFKKRNYVEFYPSGKIKSGVLNTQMIVGGIIYMPGYIEFYENGNVRKGVLGEDRQFGGKIYKRGDIMEFSPDGKVISN